MTKHACSSCPVLYRQVVLPVIEIEDEEWEPHNKRVRGYDGQHNWNDHGAWNRHMHSELAQR